MGDKRRTASILGLLRSPSGDSAWSLAASGCFLLMIAFLAAYQHHLPSGIRMVPHNAPLYRALFGGLGGAHPELVQASLVFLSLLGAAGCLFLGLLREEKRTALEAFFSALWLLVLPGTVLYYRDGLPSDACLLPLLAATAWALRRGQLALTALLLALSYGFAANPLLLLIAQTVVLGRSRLRRGSERLPLELAVWGVAIALGWLGGVLWDPESNLASGLGLLDPLIANQSSSLRSVMLNFECIWLLYLVALSTVAPETRIRQGALLLVCFFVTLLSTERWSQALFLVGFTVVLPEAAALVRRHAETFRGAQARAAVFVLYTLLIDWALQFDNPLKPDFSYGRIAVAAALIFCFESGVVRRLKEAASEDA